MDKYNFIVWSMNLWFLLQNKKMKRRYVFLTKPSFPQTPADLWKDTRQ